jgi:hypothetical protein
MAGVLSGCLAVVLALAGNIASVSAEAAAPFKVTAQDRTTLALLVPSETPSEQLKHLILALRQARRENKLGQLLPPTTPGGSRGPYGIVDVYVYSEPEWATVAALQKCLHASANTPLYVECGKHVRARYFYGLQPEDEEGSVGYAEGKRIYTKHYQKLF